MHKERENLQKLIKPCEVKEQSPKSVRDWVDFMQKNKPQTNALSAGIMLVIYGGQNVGWGIFNNHLDVQPWAGKNYSKILRKKLIRLNLIKIYSWICRKRNDFLDNISVVYWTSCWSSHRMFNLK